jgi:hypothetical protein
MRGTLRPHLAGGRMPAGAVAAALAVFISLTALVVTSGVAPPELRLPPGAAPDGSVTVSVPPSSQLIPSLPGSLLGAVAAPTRPGAGGVLIAGDVGSEAPPSHRGAGGDRSPGERRGDVPDPQSPPQGGVPPGEPSPSPGDPSPPPTSPPPPEPSGPPFGRALGHLVGAGSPPGHGGSPPGRLGRGRRAASPSLDLLPPGLTKQAGRVPPGQAK